jgi:hypothetical protein
MRRKEAAHSCSKEMTHDVPAVWRRGNGAKRLTWPFWRLGRLPAAKRRQSCYALFFGPLQSNLYSAFLKCISGTAFNALPIFRKKDIRLVQEPRGSLPSPAEFAADGGKFTILFGEVVQKPRFLNNSIDTF